MHAVPHGTCAERAPLLLQITELAIEADLPRASVLAWLRQLEKAPEECAPASCPHPSPAAASQASLVQSSPLGCLRRVQARVLTVRLEAARAAEARARVLGAAARDPGGAEPATLQEEDEPGGGERWRIARGAPYVDGAARSPCRLLP